MQQTMICVPIVNATPAIAVQVDAARAAGADLVELRVDLIGDVDAVEAFLASGSPLPVILTVRGREEGGGWAGDESERIALIERFGLALPGYVDVEFSTWQRSANLRQKIGLVAQRCDAADATARSLERPKNRLILSAHDFSTTPADLRGVFDALLATPAEVVKVACAAADASDALRMLIELERCAAARATIALSMGEAGLVSRVMAKKFGALLTFATVDGCGASAPGQPSIELLRGRYRWGAIGGATRVYGVVGWPVAHSQSPLVHNAALSADGVDAVYLPLPVQPTYEAFARFMGLVVGNPSLGIAGLSVTIPHKEHALRWLESSGGRVTALARRCGAVNTLSFGADGAWLGDNTDALGALAAIERSPAFARRGLRGVRALVLGAGGAARAIVAALVDAGADVIITNRTAERAAVLAEAFGARVANWSDRADVAYELLVNCTSMGLWPAVDVTPMPEGGLASGAVVFDTVYRPRRTRLLMEAARRNCAVIEGGEMFLHQAAAQYECWHGRAGGLDGMRAALDEADSRRVTDSK